MFSPTIQKPFARSLIIQRWGVTSTDKPQQEFVMGLLENPHFLLDDFLLISKKGISLAVELMTPEGN